MAYLHCLFPKFFASLNFLTLWPGILVSVTALIDWVRIFGILCGSNRQISESLWFIAQIGLPMWLSKKHFSAYGTGPVLKYPLYNVLSPIQNY